MSHKASSSISSADSRIMQFEFTDICVEGGHAVRPSVMHYFKLLFHAVNVTSMRAENGVAYTSPPPQREDVYKHSMRLLDALCQYHLMGGRDRSMVFHELVPDLKAMAPYALQDRYENMVAAWLMEQQQQKQEEQQQEQQQQEQEEQQEQ